MKRPRGWNKYGARKVKFDGQTFDSQLEARRYSQLKLLQRAGEISDLQLQVRFPLFAGDQPILIRSKGYPNGRQLSYVADFVYQEGGQQVIEDAKGRRTPEFKIKVALMECMGHQVRETR